LPLTHDFQTGEGLVFHASGNSLEEGRKVVVQVMQKHGQNSVRLSIEAPPEIQIAFLSADSVIFTDKRG
jgi:hypothetical protein